MLKNVREILEKEKAYMSADTINYEGHPAWAKKGLDRIEEILFLGTTGNTFYVKSDDLIKIFVSDLKNEIELNKDKISNIADLIVSARNEGLFRIIPIVALILLRKVSPHEFERIFQQVVLTGQDLSDFITLNNSFGYGFGRCVKRAIRKWLEEQVTEFYAIKYRKNIADGIAMARPNISNMKNGLLLKYIYGVKKNIPEDTMNLIFEKYPQIHGAEKFKIETDITEKLRIANEFKLPADLIISNIGSLSDEKVWKIIAKQMGTMQLLKYLNKILTCAPSFAGYIKERLTVENVKKAKIFPYRLYVAWENVNNAEIKGYLERLISEYITESFPFQEWMRELKFAICPDVSGSMTTDVKGVVPSHVAGFFSMLANPLSAYLLAWCSKIRYFYTPDEIRRMAPFEVYKKIARAAGGGTYMEYAIRPFREKNIHIDCFIIITDNEEWGSGFVREFDLYKKTVNKNAKAVFIETVGYGHTPYDPSRDDIITVCGWSDIVFKFIEKKLQIMFR